MSVSQPADQLAERTFTSTHRGFTHRALLFAGHALHDALVGTFTGVVTVVVVVVVVVTVCVLGAGTVTVVVAALLCPPRPAVSVSHSLTV